MLGEVTKSGFQGGNILFVQLVWINEMSGVSLPGKLYRLSGKDTEAHRTKLSLIKQRSHTDVHLPVRLTLVENQL